jgi:hypothetical protein
MPQRACGRRPRDLGLVAGCKLEFRYVPQPFGDHDAQFHSREVRAEAAVGPAAETPVPVQLPVHHHIITGRQVAAVAVDRPQAQPHLRSRGDGDTRNGHRFSRHPTHHRCGRLQPEYLFDEGPDDL